MTAQPPRMRGGWAVMSILRQKPDKMMEELDAPSMDGELEINALLGSPYDDDDDKHHKKHRHHHPKKKPMTQEEVFTALSLPFWPLAALATWW
jgi:uncharacterized short protein YbdD (DUF466 family)